MKPEHEQVKLGDIVFITFSMRVEGMSVMNDRVSLDGLIAIGNETRFVTSIPIDCVVRPPSPEDFKK